jgi:hypothetical protein
MLQKCNFTSRGSPPCAIDWQITTIGLHFASGIIDLHENPTVVLLAQRWSPLSLSKQKDPLVCIMKIY